MRSAESHLAVSLKRIEVAERHGLWSSKTVSQQWSKLLPGDYDQLYENLPPPAKVLVWKRYISWRLLCSSDWTITLIGEAFALAMKELNKIDGTHATQALVEMQLDAAVAFDRAGYSERAFAILQAQAEVCLLSAAQPQATPEGLIARVEEKWDSEEARFADNVVQSTQTAPAGTLPSDPVCRWQALERRLSSARRFPARSTDNPLLELGEMEVDPFAAVLFADVADFLLPPQRASLDRCISAMCTLLGGEPDKARPLPSSAFLRQKFWAASSTSRGEESSSSRLANAHAYPLSGIDAALSDVSRTLLLEAKTTAETRASCRQVLQSASQSTCRKSTAVSAFLVEVLSSKDADPSASVSKLGKRTLQGDQAENIELWIAYAAAEVAFGKISSARRAIHATLTGLPCTADQSARLWLLLVTVELDGGERLIKNLLCLAGRRRLGSVDGVALEQAYNSGETSAIVIRQAQEAFVSAHADAKSQAIAVVFGALLDLVLVGREQRGDAALALLQRRVSSHSARALFAEIAFRCATQKDGLFRQADSQRVLVEVASTPHTLALLAAHEISRRFEAQFRLAVDRLLARKDTDELSARREELWAFVIYAEANLYSHANEAATRARLESAVDECPR